jgi:hypothetical protein
MWGKEGGWLQGLLIFYILFWTLDSCGCRWVNFVMPKIWWFSISAHILGHKFWKYFQKLCKQALINHIITFCNHFDGEKMFTQIWITKGAYRLFRHTISTCDWLWDMNSIDKHPLHHSLHTFCFQGMNHNYQRPYLRTWPMWLILMISMCGFKLVSGVQPCWKESCLCQMKLSHYTRLMYITLCHHMRNWVWTQGL